MPRKFPYHFALIALYPTLALLATNVREVELWVALRPLGLSLLAAMLVFGLLWGILKDAPKSALITTLLLALFFSYGHVYKLIEGAPVIGRHRVLAPLYALALAAGVWFILRRLKNPAPLTTFLNLAGWVLLVLPLLQIGSYEVRDSQDTSAKAAGGQQALVPGEQGRPDVYYIILDSYTRADVLEQEFDLNNQPFLDGLRNLGFYVANCSQSNYDTTELSLTASLNMNYLPALSADFSPQQTDRSMLPDYLKNPVVRQMFEAAGYRSVAFETGYYWDYWEDADLFLTPQTGSLLVRQMRPFEALLLQSTAADVYLDARALLAKDVSLDYHPYAEHIRREQYVLDKMENLASVAGPKLVFAHILIPHAPIVFAADGSILTDPGYFGDASHAVNDEYYKKGYAGQVEYINARMLAILKNILSQSSQPPIIILQGDHGVNGPDRIAILNAYYLPDDGESKLYDTISPVNSFRLVFDTYFGTHFGLLPDKGYLSPDFDHSFNVVPFEESMPGCKR